MKTIIAGSRTIADYELLEQSIAECGWQITEVVSGGASGVDALGEEWATRNSVPCVRFPARM